MKEEAKSVLLVMFVTKGRSVLVKKSPFGKCYSVLCCRNRFRRNQRAIKAAKRLLWQRKISLVLKLMKRLEEHR